MQKRADMMPFTLFLLALFVGSAVWAQEKPSLSWNEIVSSAKKEGKVVVINNPDPVMRREIVPKFTARFGITVEFIAGRSSEITTRVQTERASGVYSVDVFMTGIDTKATLLYPEKMIDPLKPMLTLADVVEPSKWKTGKLWFVDPEEKYVLRVFNSVDHLLFINVANVNPVEFRSAKDLLNPKWRGKIGADDPTVIGSGASVAARFYAQLGEEFIRKLYVDQKPGFTRDRRLINDWLARGTYPVCLNCDAEEVRSFKKDGFDILEIFELSGIRPTIGGSPWHLSVANKAPHPNATRVFVNWLLSKEAMEIYSRGYGAATLRTDVDESFLNPQTIPKRGVDYFDQHDWKWALTGRIEARERVGKILRSAK